MRIGSLVRITMGTYKDVVGIITMIIGSLPPFHYLVELPSGKTCCNRGDELLVIREGDGKS